MQFKLFWNVPRIFKKRRLKSKCTELTRHSLVVPFKFSFRRMASFAWRGLRMKIVLTRYCLFFVNQSKNKHCSERLAFNVTISFITSVKQIQLEVYKSKVLSNNVKISEFTKLITLSAAAGTDSTCILCTQFRAQQRNIFERYIPEHISLVERECL